VVQLYSVEKRRVLEDYGAQNQFFYRVFPHQIELGERQSSTMDWLLKRIADSRNEPAPRELVFLSEQGSREADGSTGATGRRT
jgi:hypothetical protein